MHNEAKNEQQTADEPEPLGEDWSASSYCEEWLNNGYTIKEAAKAKNAYESWTGEALSYEDVEHAITGKGERGGLFAERVSAFFAGFRLRNPV